MGTGSPELFVIAGSNGSGKTTASYHILPDILDCKEFINADEIAHGLSPFNPASVAIEAGRLMLHRWDELLEKRLTFAFETTLATRIYLDRIRRAQHNGYQVKLIYLWLDSPELAIDRVDVRVREGGHGIPIDVIRRRYFGGIRNFMHLYRQIVDEWILIDNSNSDFEIIARGNLIEEEIVSNSKWETINKLIS